MHHYSVSLEITLLCFFSGNFISIGSKRAHQSAKLQIFDCSREISPNLYFDRLLLFKVYKISTKKVERSYVSWHWRVMQNLQKNWFVVSKMTRIWRILTGAVESLKNLHFDWFPLRRVYNIWPKKVQRTYIRWRSRLMQNLKKSDLWFGKWYEELGKLSPEHSKVSKLGIWWDPFIQRRKCMALKLRKSYESWQWRMMQNLEKNWLVVSKLKSVIWWILTWATESLKNLHFNGLFLTKCIMFELKMYGGVMFDSTKNDAKFEGKLTCAFKMTWRIWQVFTGWKTVISF